MEAIIEEWVWFYYDTCKFSIIPIKYHDKRPNIPSWGKYKKTRPTKNEIQQWLKQGLFKNIAVIGGEVSENLVCFDIDDPKAVTDLGLDIKKIIKQGAWVVETPKQKGRYHIIVRDHKKIEKTREVKQDIDKRADGHYWVVYPSIHPNGKQYNLLNTHDTKKLKPPVKVNTKKMFDDWIKTLYEKRGIRETLQDTVKTKDSYDWSPDCIRNAWELGAKPGGRYYTAVGLGSWLQQQKFPLEMAKAIVVEWFKKKCDTKGRPTDDIAAAAEVGYKGKYQTGCNWWRENTDFCPYKEKSECAFISTKNAELFNATKKKIEESDKIQIEPIYNGGKTKWLFIESNGGGEKTFITRDPNLWRCKKCGNILQQKEKPFYCNSCKQDSAFEKITDEINEDIWKLPHWKEIPIEDLNMIEIYYDLLDLTKRCVVFPDEMQYKILVLWIIASYKKECFDTIPFLIFRGLIESGKTRALGILRELGYRMMHTSGVTFPAMIRATNNWGAGILIDEIDNKIDIRTETGRNYLDFLKPSYKNGSKYFTADKDDQDKIKSYKNYGFKAFAGEKGGFDKAIFSRSIDFQMEQEYPEVPDLRYVRDELNDLQTKLLNYRYKFNDPADLPLDFDLRGRDREIFSCLVRTALHIGFGADDLIEYAKKRKKESIDELQNSDEFQILTAIKNWECNETLDDAPEVISYGKIADLCGWDASTEEGKKKRQKIGYIFKKKLNLKTKRTGDGYVLLLNNKNNQRKLQNYYRRYKV